MKSVKTRIIVRMVSVVVGALIIVGTASTLFSFYSVLNLLSRDRKSVV